MIERRGVGHAKHRLGVVEDRADKDKEKRLGEKRVVEKITKKGKRGN